MGHERVLGLVEPPLELVEPSHPVQRERAAVGHLVDAPVTLEGQFVLAHPLEHVAGLEDILLVGVLAGYDVAQAAFRPGTVSFMEIELGQFEDLFDIGLAERRLPFKARYLPAFFPHLTLCELEKLLPAQAHTLKVVDALNLVSFLSSDKLDAELAKYVVLFEATPRGLAEFAQQGKEQEQLVARLLADSDLMVQMVVADGAKDEAVARRLWERTEELVGPFFGDVFQTAVSGTTIG